MSLVFATKVYIIKSLNATGFCFVLKMLNWFFKDVNLWYEILDKVLVSKDGLKELLIEF